MAVSTSGDARAQFRRAQRLRRPAEFRDVYSKGRRIGNEMFAANVLANSTGTARLGMAIAVRAAGNAVRRNRVRRLIRESFRLHQRSLPALDIIISARTAAWATEASQLREGLARLWQRIGAS
jgi:ribonuclease P protein component